MKKLIIFLVILLSAGCTSDVLVNQHPDDSKFVVSRVAGNARGTIYTVFNEIGVFIVRVHTHDKDWEVGDSLMLVLKRDYERLTRKKVNTFNQPTLIQPTKKDTTGWGW